MTEIQEFQEGMNYSEETQYAVRYGYFYRKEAEKYENVHVHDCLGESSEILLWIANAVIGGVVYDVIKTTVKKLYHKLVDGKKKIDQITEDIITDDSKLKEYCTYVLEFYEHRITANEKQIRYIREEIIADFVGNESGSIYEKEKRQPTAEEQKVIIRDAIQLADDLIG